MREGIFDIASRAGEEPKKLLEAAIEEAPQEVRRAKSKVERVEQDLKNMGRERLLPDEKTLEKIARYRPTSLVSSTQPCTSSRPYRPSGPGEPLL